MDLSVEAQRAHKHGQVERAFQPYATLRAVAIEPVVEAALTLGYRTRAKLVVSEQGEIGLFERASHSVVDIPACLVMHPLVRATAAALRERLAGTGVPLTGVDLRWLDAGDQEALLVTLAGLATDSAALRAFAASLRGMPGVVGVALRLQARPDAQQLSGVPERIWGSELVRDTLLPGGAYHYVTYGSFVQAHRGQAASLARRVASELSAQLSAGSHDPRAAAPRLDGKRILELYAGSGALGLHLCELGAEVLLVERYAPALEHALRAAAEQGLAGLAARSGDAERILAELVERGARFDAVIVNPPRRGLAAEVRAGLARLAPDAVAYISCEPITLARDLADLSERGLGTLWVAPYDMMPNAADVESLAFLAPRPAPPIPVLYEDARLLAVDKPPYLPTVPQREHADSLLQRLQREHGLPGLCAVHRLDAQTSGVCLFAKAPQHVQPLAAALAAGQKHYLALVRGRPHEKGIVRAPLREHGQTRAATSRYVCVERYAGHTLVRVRPEQGRTHQVRKHMASIAHPVLGDARYGDSASNRYLEHRHGLTRTFLHAACIELPLSAAEQPPLRIEAPLAPDLVAVCHSLEQDEQAAPSRYSPK